MKKHISFMLSVMLLLGVMFLPVQAAGLDLDRAGSITVVMERKGKPVAGGTLTIYQVAELEVSDGNPVFRYTEEYDGCGISLEDVDSATASALAAYTRRNNVQGVTSAIGAEGRITFEDLLPGLYLLVQEKAAPGYYAVEPFLVSVPSIEDGKFVYDVVATPKHEPTPTPDKPDGPDDPDPPDEPDDPDTPDDPDVPDIPDKPDDPDVPGTPDEPDTPEDPSLPSEEEPKLPQTGQMNWPVPVLAASGTFLVILGAILLGANGRKHDEA